MLRVTRLDIASITKIEADSYYFDSLHLALLPYVRVSSVSGRRYGGVLKKNKYQF